MKQERMDVLKNVINRWEVNVEEGTVKTSRGYAKSTDERGYLQTGTSYNNRVYLFKVHEIVAFAGGLNILNKTVNHIDGNKENNSITNLEVMTFSENSKHAHKNGLIDYSKRTGENHGKSVITEKQAIEIKELLKDGLTQSEISKKLNVKIHIIKDIRRGRTWGWV